MSACHLYSQLNGTFTYYCEINNTLYSSFDECVRNCGLALDGKLLFPNVGYEGFFLVIFALVLVLVLGLMYVLLDW
jgi:hypothetical protein